MDKQYIDYKEKLENFIRRNAKNLKCNMHTPNIEIYLRHFNESATKNGKTLLHVGVANMYDDQLIERYSDKIVYFSHFISEGGVKKFCGVIQFDKTLHGVVSYGCLGDDGFVTSIDFYTTNPKKIIEILDSNKDIEFVKNYKSLGFGAS